MQAELASAQAEHDYVALVSVHGSQRAAAAAVGMPKSTFSNRYHEARSRSTTVSAPADAPDKVEASAPSPAPVLPNDALAAIVADLAKTVAQLVADRAPLTVPPEPVERAVERTVPAEPRRAEAVVGALGTNAPYDGEIFGVTNKRRPLVGAPVTSEPRLTIVLGDTHFHPALTPHTKRLMTLCGLHVAEKRPEHLVHIGDVSDLASMCQHVRNDTWGARDKPSIQQDLDCLRENWRALNAPIVAADVRVKKHVTKGNHCAWADRYEDAHPEVKGLVTGAFNDIIRSEGWSLSDYGEFYFVGDVGYVHVPLNLMGRPVGGQTGENTVAMQSTRDVVFGHTHRKAGTSRVKMDGRVVTVLNTGSSMPEYYVGEYAQLTAGRKIDYGITEVIDFDGRIQSSRFVPVRMLEALYGAEADRLLSRIGA